MQVQEQTTSKQPTATTVTVETRLREEISRFVGDPLGFVRFAFPWHKQGTILAMEDGPDKWQTELLRCIGDDILTGEQALQIAVASGHEVGKTALVAWIILWWMSTRPYPQVVVTANTGTQLETKTWRELAKWHGLALNKHWFNWTATKFAFAEQSKTWFASAIPWSKERSEAFAGTHERYVLVIFDEASTIDDIIWGVSEGALTLDSLWLAFGNPTRNTGRFKECFPGGRFAHRWKTYQVDSRDARKANQDRIQKWIDDYGEDSDFVRIRVKGLFPRASSTQFIPEDVVDAAMRRQFELAAYQASPTVIGVDVARYGDDRSVILIRQGCALLSYKTYRERSTMQLAGMVSETINQFQVPPTTFVDVVGIGAGVVDRLRDLGYHVVEVNGAERATGEKDFCNLRAETWSKMRDWLKTAMIKEDSELKADLIGPEYGFDARNRIQIERKEDMKSRGLSSPDIADALALTFAIRVNYTRDQEIQRRMEEDVYVPLDPIAGV